MDEKTLAYQSAPKGSGWGTAGAVLLGLWAIFVGVMGLGFATAALLTLMYAGQSHIYPWVLSVIFVVWALLLLHASVGMGSLAARVGRGDAEAADAGWRGLKICIAGWMVLWGMAVIGVLVLSRADGLILSAFVFLAGIPVFLGLIVTATVLARVNEGPDWQGEE